VPIRRVVLSVCCAISSVLAIGNYRPVVVHADQSFQPPNREELKMTSEPLAPGAPAIILYRQVDRDDRYPPHQDSYIRIKILTEEGRDRAKNIEIPFFKGNEEVRIQARTIEPDGSIIPFNGQVFEKSISNRGGGHYTAKTFTLPDVQVGSILEYYYTVQAQQHVLPESSIFGVRMSGSNWIVSSELFTRSARFSLTSNGVNIPRPVVGGFLLGATSNLRWSWHALPPGVEPKRDKDHIVRMEVSNVPAFQAEDLMPPANELKARVDFTYSELDDKNPESYWKTIGKGYDAWLERFVGRRRAMEEAVGQIISPSDPPETKLRKIYERVQQVHNISYDERKTEQELKRENEKADENVEDVWKRGYGTRSQITWLYLALVRAAGFEASGALVSDRQNYFFSPVTMQSYKLDSPVVLVKLNGKDLYFDPGAEFTPFGLLTWSETGVQGLRLDRNGGTWIKTTLPPSSESRVERHASLKLSDTGDLEGKLTVTYTGLVAVYDRLAERDADAVARKKFLEEYVKSQIPVTADVELTNHPDWSGSGTPLVAEFDLKIPEWASNAGKRVVVPAGVFTGGEKKIFEHANRTNPIYFEYPYEKLDDVTITLPAGWQAGNLPSEQGQDTRLVGYSRKVEGGKDSVHLTRKLKIDFIILDAKFYPALRSFYQSVRTADEEQIVLQPGATSASKWQQGRCWRLAFVFGYLCTVHPPKLLLTRLQSRYIVAAPNAGGPSGEPKCSGVQTCLVFE
jgi:hypothetical protein